MGFWKSDIRIHSCGQVARMFRYLGLNTSISFNSMERIENQSLSAAKIYKFWYFAYLFYYKNEYANDKILNWK